MTDNYLLGRQPILDREEKIAAYELLFRTAESPDQARIVNGSSATATVITNTLAGIGARNVLGDNRGIINVEHELFMSDAMALLPVDRIILGLKQNMPLTGDVQGRCRQLKEAGFTIALDNHEFRPELEGLYQAVNIIGIDVQQTPLDRLHHMATPFRRYPVQLLAAKVETREQFQVCQALGFDFFEGYFFARPSVITQRKFNENTTSLIRIVHQIISDAELEIIVRIFQESPGLTYKLLLLANSVIVGARNEITSIRHAISLLGRNQIRRWAQLELFAADPEQGLENPLVDMASVRASFMEHLAKSHPVLKGFSDAAGRASLIGTLSMMEMIYNIHIEDVVKSVQLSDDIRIALLRRAGLFGDMLKFVEALERLEFDRSQELLVKMNIPHEKMLEAQRMAFLWKTGGASDGDQQQLNYR